MGSIDFFGFDKIEFAVREPGTQSKTTTATLWINIKAANDKPKIITNPVNFTIGYQPYMLFGIFSVSDIDNSYLKTNLSTTVGAFSSTDVVSCYSSNIICTYEGRIVDTNKVLNSLALRMPLGYFGNITIAITVSDEEFMVRTKLI